MGAHADWEDEIGNYVLFIIYTDRMPMINLLIFKYSTPMKSVIEDRLSGDLTRV